MQRVCVMNRIVCITAERSSIWKCTQRVWFGFWYFTVFLWFDAILFFFLFFRAIFCLLVLINPSIIFFYRPHSAHIHNCIFNILLHVKRAERTNIINQQFWYYRTGTNTEVYKPNEKKSKSSKRLKERQAEDLGETRDREREGEQIECGGMQGRM